MQSQIADLAAPWTRALKAANRAPTTVTIYGAALRLLTGYLEREGLPTAVGDIRRIHIEGFVGDLLERQKPASVSAHFRSLRVFFKWAVENEIDDIVRSPMERMRPPSVPETPPRIPTDQEVKALLRACRGKTFRDRRDAAIVSLLADTGMRLAECAGITLSDLDLDAGTARVMGKGRRVRVCRYGNRTGTALDHYLRARASHRLAQEEALWLGHMGTMTPNGVHHIVKDRAKAAGMPWLHPHLLRSYFAHTWLSRGGSQVELMTACGWRQASMVARYTASTAAERAHKTHERIGVLDRLG